MMKKVIVLFMLVMFTFSTIPKKSEAIIISGPLAIAAVSTITWQAVAATATFAIVGGFCFAIAEDGTKIAIENIRDNIYEDDYGNQYKLKKNMFGRTKLEKL